MDFFQHQEQARRNTGRLVVYFVLAVISIIAAVYLAIVAVFFYAKGGGSHDSPPTLWLPDVLVGVSGVTLAIITAGSAYKMIELTGGGETVTRSLGGRRVTADTRDLRERVLLNVVEEMAIASGTPVPPVYLLDHEPAINAFAAGTTPQNAVIGVTRGTIDTLKRDELQGVIAHEFSHILNGDMRLNIRLIGILNGILLIAMIGYVLLRTGGSSERSYRSSDGEKKGGNPLPLLGLLLYLIGYIGVFFGNLIKSAVSRQREFLADASAVQFTRLPDGIAGALRKIGGLAAGSRLETAHAEEASHMFFGNGMRMPFLEMLSTHPPLAERVRRIDPSFDGKFPPAEEVEYTASDLIDPRGLASRLTEPGGVHAAALAGASSLTTAPAAAVAHVGAPRQQHLDYAAALVNALPPKLAVDVRDPLGAVAAIYALLLDEDESDVRREQLRYLAESADPRAYQETLRVAPSVAQVQAEARLPLVSMVLPALKGLSPKQLEAFGDDVVFLIRADKQVSLFEYAVHRLVLRRLVARLAGETQPPQPERRGMSLSAACSGLLSTLATYGNRDSQLASRAFELGAAQLRAGQIPIEVKLLPAEQSGLSTLDAALDQLAAAPPQHKKQILEACAACIGADARVTVEEGELLRVISDALDCPMPPLVG